MTDYEYLHFDISFSSPKHRKKLFSKVEYIDDYKWYCNLNGTESTKGDHYITVRTQDPVELRRLICELDAKYMFDTLSLPLSDDIPKIISCFDIKYSTETSS